MKVLIVHHVEPMWQAAFDEEPELYVDRIVEFITEGDYDQVIMTTLEGDAYPYLERTCTKHEEWSYAWEDPDDPRNAEWYHDSDIDPETEIIPASGHDWAYVYPWIAALKNDEVSILGGAQYECLADLQDTLFHLEIPYTRIQELIYG